MRLPSFDYHEPATLEEALVLMAEHSGELRILGGGTELLPLMKALFMTANPIMVKDALRLQGFDVGSVRLTERHVKSDPPSAADDL